MVKFYPERTIEEQKARLPQSFQDNYERTVLDQVEIDGNIIRGYMEYSFLNEKSYFEQPTRSLNGSIENINTYATFLTPRLVIKYNMMNIEDYRKLMMLLQSKNEFLVTCYDPVLDKRVTHYMYAAPSPMPVIYQQYLMALGVQEYSIELIGTNNGVAENKITYDYNIPSDWNSVFGAFDISTVSLQTIPSNVSDIIGGQYTTISFGSNTYRLSQIDGNYGEEEADLSRYLKGYIFQGWNTKADGSGFTYLDGNVYFVNSDTTLYAMWVKG